MLHTNNEKEERNNCQKNALREASKEKFERDIYSLKDMYTLREITTTHAQSIKKIQFIHYYLF